MRMHPALSFANIYLGRRIDSGIRKKPQKYGKDGNSALQLFKRFMDDLIHIPNSTKNNCTKCMKKLIRPMVH